MRTPTKSAAMKTQLNIRMTEEDLKNLDWHRAKVGLDRAAFVRSILIQQSIITPM